MMITLNPAGTSNLAARIAGGDVDKSSDWSFAADDGNKLLGADGNDWTNFGKWFLGLDDSAAEQTKARYKYPFGKDGKVYRSALVAIRDRAAQQNDETVFDSAGRYLQEIDGNKSMRLFKAPALVQRAYAKFEIKSADEAQRILTGIATTPTPDRMADIVEPMGAEYELPIPFLWQHDSMQPVGWVTQAKQTATGIPVTIQMATIDEPGTLKDRLEEAWQSLKIGLVRGLSIGFAPIEYSFLDDSNGIRFLRWNWLELSGVTIPANAEATISTIKAFDARQRVPSNRERVGSVKLITPNPDVSGKPAARGMSVKLITP